MPLDDTSQTVAADTTAGPPPELAAQIAAARAAGHDDGAIFGAISQSPRWGGNVAAALKAGHQPETVAGFMGLTLPQPMTSPEAPLHGNAVGQTRAPDRYPVSQADIDSIPDRSGDIAEGVDSAPVSAPPVTELPIGTTEFGLPATTPGRSGPPTQKVTTSFDYAPSAYTPTQQDSGLIYPPGTDPRNAGLTNADTPRASQTAETVVPGQGIVRATVAAGQQGLTSGIGTQIAGIGEAAQTLQNRHGEQILAAMNSVDSGDVQGAMRSLTPAERGELATYLRAPPEQKATMRAARESANSENALAGPNPIARSGQAIKDFGQKSFPVNRENEGAATNIARGAGSLVALAPAAAVGTLAGGPAGTLATIAAIGSQSYDQTLTQATAAGASRRDAENAAATDALTQMGIMALPVGHLLSRFPEIGTGLYQSLIDMAKRGVEFGGFNAVGQFASNYVAKNTYKPDQDLFEGVPEAAATGAVLGTGMHVPAVLGAGAEAVRSGGRYAPALADYMAHGPGETPEEAAGRTSREQREANAADMAAAQSERPLLVGQEASQPAPAPDTATEISGPQRPLTPEAAAAQEAEEAPPTARTPVVSIEGSDHDVAVNQPGSTVDQAAAGAVEPTPAQAEAGNYAKGHITIGGLPIAIETPRGGVRRGVDENGDPWETTMPAHYGYVKRTSAADGDHLDVSLGPLADTAPQHPVFVVDQINPGDRSFDEHKGFLGFPNLASAVAAYDASFSDGSGPSRRAGVTEMPFGQFKEWATQGDLTRPVAPVPARQVPVPFVSVPKEPLRLSDFLRQDFAVGRPGDIHTQTSHGGLRDPGGDLTAIIGGNKGVPQQRGGRGFRGLANNATGSTLDDAALRAWEAGYFPEHDQRPSINDLLNKLDEDINRGNPAYSHYDQDAVDAYHEAIGHNSEVDRLASRYGIPTRGLTREQFFDRLANHVSLEDASREHDEATAAHQDAYDQWVQAARGLGHDPEAYTPRSLEEMENERRQADAAQATGAVSAGRHGPEVAGGREAPGEGRAGQGGRGVGNTGRVGAEGGAGLVDQAAAYRDELPGELAESPIPLFSPVERAVSGLREMAIRDIASIQRPDIRNAAERTIAAVENSGLVLTKVNRSGLSDSTYLRFERPDGKPIDATKSGRRRYVSETNGGSFPSMISGGFNVRVSDHPGTSGPTEVHAGVRIGAPVDAGIDAAAKKAQLLVGVQKEPLAALNVGRRLPPPPKTGPDLFGATRAQPVTRTPEPTIRDDQRQAVMPGMEPSAVQAQAAHDAQGPRGGQLAPNEGLFARPETPQPARPARRVSRWLNTENFRDLLNEAPAAGHHLAADWVFNRGRETGHEHVAVVDNRTGEIIHAGTSGLEKEVKWKGDNGAADLPANSLTIHHNHPNDSALSGADVGMLPNPAVSHVVSHGDGGSTTIASLTPTWGAARGTTPASMGKVWRDLSDARFHATRVSRAILQDLVDKGDIEPRHADQVFEDVTNRLLQAHGVINYSSTHALAQPIKDALAPVLRKLGHADAEAHDRYTIAVRPEERIASLPAPVAGAAGQGSAGGPGRDQERAIVSVAPENDVGRGGDRLVEGEGALRSGEELTAAQRAALHHIGRNGPLPPRETPNLVEQGPPRPIRQFKTAKGSVYQVHEDGTTTRNKAYRPEHGDAEQGIQPRSAKTVYVDPEQLKRLAPPVSGWRIMAEPDGTYSLMTDNNTPVGWGYSPSGKNVPVETEPRPGLMPMELWKPETIAGRTMYGGMHPGNAITSVSHAQPRIGDPSERNPQSAIPLSEPPQPPHGGMGHNGPPPDSLWPPNEQPPERPPLPPEVEAARISVPQAVKNLNPVENLTIFPRTLASLDEPSARLWGAWQAREREATTNADQLRRVIANNFLKLDKPDRLKVAGALEIARIEGVENLIENPDGTLTARNTSTPFARWSKVGDAITLNPRETAAYHEAVQLGKDQWTMLMQAAAKRYGWGGDLDPAAIRAEASSRGEPGDYKRLNRLADLLDVMKQHEQDIYFPMQRFGSYFIAVTPKQGEAVVANMGGHPPLAWFETVEKPAFQDMMGVTQGRFSVQAAAAKRIAELQKQFSPDQFDYRQGDFVKTPQLLRQLNIPAIEKLFMLMENRAKAATQEQVMRSDNPPTTRQGVREEAKNRYDALHGATLEAFYDALFEELKSGYRRRAKVVPGYSAQFDRAISSHLYQIARNAADTVHRDGVESAYQNIQDFHAHENVRRYWKKWRDYQEDPGSTLGRAAETMNQIGFTYMLGMNPSSTLIIASHMPMTAAPVLSVGVGPSVAVPAMVRGLGRAYGALRFDMIHGGHIDIDKAMAGMPPEKQAYLRLMASEGRLAAVGTHDMAALNERLSQLFGGHADMARRGMEIATSNVHAVDQANRFAVASTAWDIAFNPTNFNKAAAPLMRHNAIFRDMVQREGLSPETFGRFMLSQAAFDWGKANQAPIMRGPLGRLMFALHGFQTRYLSTALSLMKNSGPEGRFGWGLMMAALGLGAGALGLPFSQDAMSGADSVWHYFTGRDPMLKFKLHDAIQDAGFGEMGADMILHGPISAMTGINLGSRIGFGDVLSREFESSNALGTIPSIAWSAYTGMSQRIASGQPAAAIAAEGAPAVARGPLRALAATQQGIVSRAGIPQVAPEDLSRADIAKVASGFQPMTVEHHQEEVERYLKTQHSQEAWKTMIRDGDAEAAVDEMIKAGWGIGRRKELIRDALRAPAPGKQFQRFEQQRGVAPPP